MDSQHVEDEAIAQARFDKLKKRAKELTEQVDINLIMSAMIACGQIQRQARFELTKKVQQAGGEDSEQLERLLVSACHAHANRDYDLQDLLARTSSVLPRFVGNQLQSLVERHMERVEEEKRQEEEKRSLSPIRLFGEEYMRGEKLLLVLSEDDANSIYDIVAEDLSHTWGREDAEAVTLLALHRADRPQTVVPKRQKGKLRKFRVGQNLWAGLGNSKPKSEVWLNLQSSNLCGGRCDVLLVEDLAAGTTLGENVRSKEALASQSMEAFSRWASNQVLVVGVLVNHDNDADLANRALAYMGQRVRQVNLNVADRRANHSGLLVPGEGGRDGRDAGVPPEQGDDERGEAGGADRSQEAEVSGDGESDSVVS